MNLVDSSLEVVDFIELRERSGVEDRTMGVKLAWGTPKIPVHWLCDLGGSGNLSEPHFLPYQMKTTYSS
jgi:hypothetical protein